VVVEWARAEQLLVIPVCPFAKSMFERDASIRDVLA
jgi:predicted GNAT family acetyltransferase